MTKICRSLSKKIFQGIFLIMLLVTIAACAPPLPQTQEPQATPKIAPPVPEEPVSDLQLPEPPLLEPIRGKADVSKEIPLGFALDVSEIIITEDWNVVGDVRASEPGMLTINTQKDEVATLAYRLPEGMNLVLEAGQPITLLRSTKILGATLDYQLNITSQDRVALASARRHSNSPIKLEIWNGITLRQSEENGKELSRGKYETTYQIPINLSIEGRQEILEPNQRFELDFGGQKLVLIVTTSQLSIPQKGYEGVSEGHGYILECVLIAR